MSSDDVVHTVPDAAAPGPRLRIPVGLMALFWAVIAVTALVEMPTFNRFMTRMGTLLVVGLAFVVWWGFNRRITWRDRLIVLAAAVAAPVLAKLLSDKTLGPISVMYGLPLLFTAWAAWLVL